MWISPFFCPFIRMVLRMDKAFPGHYPEEYVLTYFRGQMPYRFPELQPLTLHHGVNCIPRSVADETMNSVSVQSHGRVVILVEWAVGHLEVMEDFHGLVCYRRYGDRGVDLAAMGAPGDGETRNSVGPLLFRHTSSPPFRLVRIRLASRSALVVESLSSRSSFSGYPE